MLKTFLHRYFIFRVYEAKVYLYICVYVFILFNLIILHDVHQYNIIEKVVVELF